jgi:hypothetical protein
VGFSRVVFKETPLIFSNPSVRELALIGVNSDNKSHVVIVGKKSEYI